MRTTTAHAVVLCALAAAPLASCKRPRRAGAVAADAGRADASPGFRVPAVLPAPGTRTEREMDAPLAWIYAVEAPSPTGFAPDAIVGAEVPCGFRAMLGDVSQPPSPLRVRLRVRRDGPPPDPARPCPARPVVVVPISLQRLRLAEFTVTDAAPHGPGDPPVPSIALSVVEDNDRTPPVAMRRARRCTPDDDATCAAGGACGGVPGRAGVGVCAPPLDPYLVLGRPCPAGSVEVRLERARPFGVRAAPEPADFRACVPACDATHACAAPMACLDAGGGRSACLPQ